MSNDALNAVRKLDIRPSGRKFVLIALANYADENWVCFPAVRHISEFTGQGDKTVRDHLISLENEGFIKRSRQRRKDGTLGRFLFTIAKHKVRSVREIPPEAKIATGEIKVQPPASSAEHIHHNNTSSLSPLSCTLEAEEFEVFWKAYPQKVAYPLAKQAFLMARKKVSLDVILDGVIRYASKTDDRPWCNPQRWLAEERWNDEPLIPYRHHRSTNRQKPEMRTKNSLSNMVMFGGTHDL